MKESQIDIKEDISRLFIKYKQLNPDIALAYDALPMEIFKDGLLSGKTKRLMALTASVVAGCRACILYQTSQALELGATAEEIMETLGVAISLGGTMAAG